MTQEARAAYLARHKRFCHHYDGHRVMFGDGKCGCSIDVRDRFGELALTWPCISVDTNRSCPVSLQRSEQAINAEFDETERAALQVLTALPEIHEWAIGKTNGTQNIVVCPLCKGNLHLLKQKTNGHIWAKCETPKCVEFLS